MGIGVKEWRSKRKGQEHRDLPLNFKELGVGIWEIRDGIGRRRTSNVSRRRGGGHLRGGDGRRGSGRWRRGWQTEGLRNVVLAVRTSATQVHGMAMGTEIPTRRTSTTQRWIVPLKRIKILRSGNKNKILNSYDDSAPQAT
uniref:Uncharacterized protein n=1 Tax=Oryza meridionalis TaxID=40149 RepID=A0A0E0F538_9ORYZ